MTESRVANVFKQFRRTDKTREGQPFTHVFSTGGTFVVPNDEEIQSKIFEALKYDIDMGTDIYVQEIPSNVFNMFVDMNLTHIDILSNDDLSRIVKEIQGCFAKFYPASTTAHNARFFECVVTQADAMPLCTTRPEFVRLIEPRPKFDGTQTVKVEDGRAKCTGDADYLDVQWRGPPAKDGCYQCNVDMTQMVVTLLTSNAPSFANPMVRLDALDKCVRTGSPANAIRVVDEMKVTGEWQHRSPNAIFALNDTEYFVNTSRSETGMVKTDLHVHFPAMHVTIDQALYMREALVHTLHVALGDEFVSGAWCDALPTRAYATSVTTYMNSGLRMCGSNKTIPCLQCRKRSRDDLLCTVPRCKQGKVDLRMPFRLRSVFVDGIPDSELTTQYSTNNLLLLKRTSIRTFLRDSSPNWKRFDGCPQFGDILKKAGKSDDGLPVHKMKGNASTTKEKTAYGTTDLIDVSDGAIWSIFERHIQKDFDRRRHGTLRVSGVRFSPSKKVYFINVAGIGQHWCLNLLPPADHTDSTIYFQCCFAEKGICARCRCTDPSTERRHKGPCSKYHSTYKKLAPSEMARVFQ